MHPLVEALTRIVRTGDMVWDVRYDADTLPPGAWLRRVRPTGTLLDLPFFDTTYIHPLEAVAVYAGRFEKQEERKAVMMMQKARSNLRDACRLWGSGCGLKTRGEAARWFFLFTPVGPPPLHEPYATLRTRGVAQAASLWGRLDIPGDFDRAEAAANRATRSPVYRPGFWTTEVHRN